MVTLTTALWEAQSIQGTWEALPLPFQKELEAGFVAGSNTVAITTTVTADLSTLRISDGRPLRRLLQKATRFLLMDPLVKEEASSEMIRARCPEAAPERFDTSVDIPTAAFLKALKEPSGETLLIPEFVSQIGFRSFVEFLRTGTLPIDAEKIGGYISIAEAVGLHPVSKACMSYLSKVTTAEQYSVLMTPLPSGFRQLVADLVAARTQRLADLASLSAPALCAVLASDALGFTEEEILEFLLETFSTTDPFSSSDFTENWQDDAPVSGSRRVRFASFSSCASDGSESSPHTPSIAPADSGVSVLRMVSLSHIPVSPTPPNTSSPKLRWNKLASLLPRRKSSDSPLLAPQTPTMSPAPVQTVSPIKLLQNKTVAPVLQKKPPARVVVAPEQLDSLHRCVRLALLSEESLLGAVRAQHVASSNEILDALSTAMTWRSQLKWRPGRLAIGPESETIVLHDVPDQHSAFTLARQWPQYGAITFRHAFPTEVYLSNGSKVDGTNPSWATYLFVDDDLPPQMRPRNRKGQQSVTQRMCAGDVRRFVLQGLNWILTCARSSPKVCELKLQLDDRYPSWFEVDASGFKLRAGSCTFEAPNGSSVGRTKPYVWSPVDVPSGMLTVHLRAPSDFFLLSQ
eukprot:TRINITY_DN82943_c0_g1_i1.p1 TRINITY_DN82943_c0_g1~~TRINITY_DN82943_c0_g1_i1.p1  ORF type:complete len:637 (-),score=78.31 TRINITY_DN82943_c0_g1_i1:124-2013(-)